MRAGWMNVSHREVGVRPRRESFLRRLLDWTPFDRRTCPLSYATQCRKYQLTVVAGPALISKGLITHRGERELEENRPHRANLGPSQNGLESASSRSCVRCSDPRGCSSEGADQACRTFR
jgi:hypothetical protein